MLAQSVLGLFFQAEYRDVDWIRATWLGNDWVTLGLAVPLLVGALVLAAGGSIRGLLLWLGMLGFAAYNYAYYLFGAALNVFFPLYVSALVLSGVALIQMLSHIDVLAMAGRFRSDTPVRAIGGYLAFVGVALAAVWLSMWAAYAFAGRPTPIEPEAFKLVAALDLTVMVTTLTVGGALLWQRRPWGYVLAAIAGVQGSRYLLVLSVNSALAIHRGAAEPPGELRMWGSLAVLTITATLLLLVGVRSESTGSVRCDRRG